MSKTYAPSTIAKACAILDGIVAISKNEQLIHGQYITRITRADLADQGSPCGGRQACLVGSFALAATPGADYSKADALVESIQDTGRGDFTAEVNRRAHTRIALEALNASAIRILKAEAVSPSATAILDAWRVPAEGYFETHLLGLSKADTHKEIVKLCRAAKRRVKAQVRP